MSKAIKIAWFAADTPRDIVLTSNGKSLDQYCTKCETDEDLKSGNYTMDNTFLVDEKIVDLLEEECILKVLLDYGYEIFRISKVDTGLRYINTVSRQITIPETMHMYLEDVRPTDSNGQGYMSRLLSDSIADNVLKTKEIFMRSDIARVSTSYFEDMDVHSALFDCDQSFINRLGGEVQRRGYTLTINEHIGTDRGVSIREKKNLTGFTGSSNVDSLVTVARGKGFNGILGSWIKSPLADQYHFTYRKTIEFQDVKVNDDSTTDGFNTLKEAQEELNKRISREFNENGIDKIKATYNISFVQLEKTKEYKNYVQAERVFLGDTIRVYIPKIKTDVKLRAIEKKYDVLAQRTKEITISNNAEYQAMTMQSVIADLKAEYKKSNNPSIASYIDAIIKAGMQDSYLVVRQNELLVMDKQDLNTATNVVRLNRNGLAFSQTGYYGEYEYGFTIDGKINASLIATGILSTVVIQNADGSFRIDLSQHGGAQYYNNGKLAMLMANNQLKLYNWAKDGDYIGSVGSLVSGNDPNKPLISIWNDLDSALSIGYQSDKEESKVISYIEFDKYGILGNEYPIEISEKARINELHVNELTVDRINFVGSNGHMSASEQGNIGVWDVDFYIKGEKVYPGTGGHGGGGTTGGGTATQLAVVESARKLVGKPYRYGGNYPPLGESDGTDCSGLCQWAYNDNGISIARTTYQQIDQGREVQEDELLPGDLIFPYARTEDNHHVFMYSGEASDGSGHMCVEAYATGYPIRECHFTWTTTTRARRIID